MEIDSDPIVPSTPVGKVPFDDTAPNTAGNALDLVFVLDCTGSMGSYIASATKNIEVIVQNIIESGKLPSLESLRVGIISYRDHPPQDNSYITQTFNFTEGSNVPALKAHLKTLYASGGGDGPEAVTAALRACYNLTWRRGASKMAVIIADAPAHGIGEYGDGFVGGSPDGEDPLRIAREMAAQGITLFSVACEPALSGYQFATDFFRALTKITGATMVPLTTASLLSHVIVGSALEQMDMEALIAEVGQAVAQKIHQGMESVDDVAKELHERLLLRQVETKQLVVESIHRESPEATHNVDVFFRSETLAEAKPLLKKVVGSRFTDKYLQSRYTSSSSYARTTPYPSLISSTSTPLLPPRTAATTALTPPSSPPRKVISEFKSFAAAPGGMSMAATPLGNGEEDPMDAITQSVELRFQAISLDQAKRITQASAWRSAPPRA